MEKRLKKQIIISLIYLAIFLTFFWLIFSWWRERSTPKELCLDGVRNQNEEGVDCGGVCGSACIPVAKYDLSADSAGFVEAGSPNRYDFYGEVSNPNHDFGSNEFQYSFKIKDSLGNVITVKSGRTFILPGEKKYILENNVESAVVPASVELEVRDPSWIEFVGYEKPQLKIVNKNYTKISSGVGFGEAIGLLKNESPFDFSLIKIQVVLKDAENKVLALNSTEIRTVKSGENREFRALWLNNFSGTVGNMEVQAEVNVFDSDSFAKRYFRAQKFQEYQK